MTSRERKQPKAVFISAGRNAFLIGTDFNNNPYSEQPYRGWWAKGHLDEANRKVFIRPEHGVAPQLRFKYPMHTRVPYGTPIQEKTYVRRARTTYNSTIDE